MIYIYYIAVMDDHMINCATFIALSHYSTLASSELTGLATVATVLY